MVLRANKKSNWCTVLDKYGNVEKLAVGIIRTWDVEEENVNVDEFFERFFKFIKIFKQKVKRQY